MPARQAAHPFRSLRARETHLANYDRQAREWPVPAESHTVETSAGQTHVRISGPVGAMVDDGYLGLRSFKRIRPVTPTLLGDEELRSLGVPTLYMVGENERLNATQEAAAHFNRIAPQIATEIVAGAGHDLTIAQTDAVNAAIRKFVA